MKSCKWLIFIIFISSCKGQEVRPCTSVRFVETKRECLIPAKTVTIDTSTALIRQKNKEIHLLRTEIDALKKKLEKVRKLQVLDSIIKKSNE